MSLQALSDYTIISRYSSYLKDKKRRETWTEMTDRVFLMHSEKYKDYLHNEELIEEFDFAHSFVKKKRVLGSQRALQFGGDPIRKHQAKIYNCSYGYIDRVAAFSEAMYLLLCGCGVGFSVQRKHVNKLPDISPNIQDPLTITTYTTYTPEDSIEGWSECVRVLVESYFVGDSKYFGKNINFNLSNIRPEGAMIAGRFKAPGPEGLRSSLEKMKQVFEDRLALGETRLHAIDVYDIIMHASDAVLSGGVRRSATICLFSKDDPEMMSAKTGDWFIKNPQRGRSNNSVLLLKDEISREEFASIMKSTREFGEPGFVFADSEDIGYNPCVAGDSVIKLPDGKTTNMKELVERLQKGEEVPVISYNTETKEEEIDVAKFGVKTRESANVIKIALEDDRVLKLTPNHQVLTNNRGYVEAAKLNEEDDIVTDSLYDKDSYQEFKEATPVNYINQEKWTNVVFCDK